MLTDVRMDEVVAVLGKMSQYRVAALFIALDDLEAVGEGMAVLVRLQLFGQVVVVETPVTVVPQFYGSLVYPYVTLDVRPAVLQGQDIVLRTYTGFDHVSARLFLRVGVVAFPRMKFREICEQVVHHGIRFLFDEIRIC